MYAGIDPMRFLRTTDDLERIVMQKVAEEADKLQEQLAIRRAQIQANEIGRLFR